MLRHRRAVARRWAGPGLPGQLRLNTAICPQLFRRHQYQVTVNAAGRPAGRSKRQPWLFVHGAVTKPQHVVCWWGLLTHFNQLPLLVVDLFNGIL